MVVSVVVRDRTDGAGEEKVLSPPRRESNPPPAVLLVPASDEAPCEGAVIEWDASWSVDTVGAMDRAPAVGGGRPSVDDRSERRLASSDVSLDVLALRAVEYEYTLVRPAAGAAEAPSRPDCGYGLLFFDRRFFFACIFSW